MEPRGSMSGVAGPGGEALMEELRCPAEVHSKSHMRVPDTDWWLPEMFEDEEAL